MKNPTTTHVIPSVFGLSTYQQQEGAILKAINSLD